MSLLDLLQSFINPQQNYSRSDQGSAAPQQQSADGFGLGAGILPNPTNGVMVAQGPPTTDELTVTASPRSANRGPSVQAGSFGDQQLISGVDANPQFAQPTPQTRDTPGINYNNRGTLDAVQSANAQDAPNGGANGLYGILPKSFQHGTLRNILGHLGDAMLVTSGMQPTYEPYLERQALGNAMAGIDFNDPASIQAGLARMAATGAPGASEEALKMGEIGETSALRKAQMENTNQWRLDREADLQHYRDQETANRNQMRYQQMYGFAVQDLKSAKNAADYQARVANWNARLKQIDPKADVVSAFGVPDTYDPTYFNGTSGLTANQATQSQDRANTVAAGERNTDVRAGAQVRSAGINAGGHVAAAQVSANRPSQANLDEQYINSLPPGERAAARARNFAAHNSNRYAHGPVGGTTSPPVAYGPGGKRMIYNGKAWVPG